jgi:hypothetical protein
VSKSKVLPEVALKHSYKCKLLSLTLEIPSFSYKSPLGYIITYIERAAKRANMGKKRTREAEAPHDDPAVDKIDIEEDYSDDSSDDVSDINSSSFLFLRAHFR